MLPPSPSPPAPPPLFLSLFSLRAGADAKECSNKELNICKHTMINTTHFTRRSAGDGRKDLEGNNSSKTAPQIANSWSHHHRYIDRCIKGRGVSTLSSWYDNSALVIWCKEEAEQRGQPNVFISRITDFALWTLWKVVPRGRTRGWARGVSRLFSPGCSHQGGLYVCVCVIDWCSYLTACCLSCSLLCGRQQIALLEFGHVPMNINLSVCLSINPLGMGHMAI